MPSKRKASEQPTGACVTVKRARTDGVISSLTPVEERKLAVKGNPDPEMLRMLCLDTNSNMRKELHFKKIVHADIDWDNKDHIDKINAWRNQIYGRAGIKSKTVLMWHKDEEAWLELYWQLVILESKKRHVKVPSPKDIRDAFNAFFRGRVLHSVGGEKLEPRVDRPSGPFTSKMSRVAKPMRAYLEEKMRGKRGEAFFPVINEEMLVEYQKLKADLAELHCSDTKIIPWQEVEDGFNNKDYVLRCRQYFTSLPDCEAGEKDSKLVDPDEDAETTVALNSPALRRDTFPLVRETTAVSEESVTLVGDADNNKILHKRRTDSVAATVTSFSEPSSELTLVGEGSSIVASIEDDIVQHKSTTAAEHEAASALLSMFQS